MLSEFDKTIKKDTQHTGHDGEKHLIDENLPELQREIEQHDRNSSSRITELENWAKGIEQGLYATAERDDLNRTIDAVKTDLDAHHVANSTIEALLQQMASERPSMREAWQNRYRNPQFWEQTLKAATGRVGLQLEEMSKDAEMREHARLERSAKEAARHFVSGSSTKEVSEPKMTPERLSRMSDSEFWNYERELIEGSR